MLTRRFPSDERLLFLGRILGEELDCPCGQSDVYVSRNGSVWHQGYQVQTNQQELAIYARRQELIRRIEEHIEC